MAGAKLGAGLGLILIAIAEMIGAQSGIGYMIWNAWQLMAVDTMFVGLIVIALLGFPSAGRSTKWSAGSSPGRRGAKRRL